MFNNSKQERKHLIIVKQYHKADFIMILCMGKKIIKETSREGRRGAFSITFLEEQTHSRPSFLFFFIILLFCLRMEG